MPALTLAALTLSTLTLAALTLAALTLAALTLAALTLAALTLAALTLAALTLAALTLAALTLAACIDIGISSIGIVIESMAALALEVRTGIVSIFGAFPFLGSLVTLCGKAPSMSSVVLFTNTLILSQSTWRWWFQASCLQAGCGC